MSTRRLRSEAGAAPGAAGSIEQHLDMSEKGPLRGEEQLRTYTEHPNFHVDESEWNREGFEQSGDEHSAGMQGSTEMKHPIGEAPQEDPIAIIPQGLRFRWGRDHPAETKRRRDRAEEMRMKNRARSRR